MRLRAVDSVVATLDQALARKGETLKALERWKAEMPTEEEMLPKDKYTIFDRKEKRYRKGIHSTFYLHCWCPCRVDRLEVKGAGDGGLTRRNRAAQVDEGVAARQPAGLLGLTDDVRDETMHISNPLRFLGEAIPVIDDPFLFPLGTAK